MVLDPEQRRAEHLARMRKVNKRRRRGRAVGDVAVVGGAGLVFLFWLACVLMPFALMAAAIYYLLTH